MNLFLIVAISLSAAVFGAQQSSSEAATAGEALFFGKAGCASCHAVNRRGGVAGPDLSAVGQTSPEALRVKILNPNNSAQASAGGRGGPVTIVAKTKDGDSAEDVILVDRMWRGQNRKLLLHADRNAMFYMLDRTNGKFLSGTPFVYQNWNKGFDEKGRPIQIPGSNSSPEGSQQNECRIHDVLHSGSSQQNTGTAPQCGIRENSNPSARGVAPHSEPRYVRQIAR